MMPHDHHHPPGGAPAMVGPLLGPPVPGTVNVIFRGMFLFIQRKKMIDILIPNIGSEHVYRAGLFLGETNLANRSIADPYLLLGTNKGMGFIPDVVFEDYDYRDTLTMDEAWARIVLPKPHKVYALRPTLHGVSAVDPFGLVNNQNFNTIHIFQYAAADLRAVYLRGHSTPNIDDPGIHAVGSNNFLNLHVLAEPEDLGSNMFHPIHGFERLMNLMHGLNGSIVLTSDQPTTLQTIEDAAGGLPSDGSVSIGEIMTYSEQRLLTIRAGRMWRAGLDAAFALDAVLVDNPPNGCLPGKGGDFQP
jgi:hypothetical protein